MTTLVLLEMEQSVRRLRGVLLLIDVCLGESRAEKVLF